jgi:hypothetical protein
VQALRDGTQEGAAEGTALGSKVGQSYGEELGFYLGLSKSYQLLIDTYPETYPSKAIPIISSLIESIEAFPQTNDKEMDILSAFQKIRLKYKRLRLILALSDNDLIPPHQNPIEQHKEVSLSF